MGVGPKKMEKSQKTNMDNVAAMGYTTEFHPEGLERLHKVESGDTTRNRKGHQTIIVK